MQSVRRTRIAFVVVLVFTLLQTGRSHAESLSDTQLAIRKTATTEASQAFADDFAVFFGQLVENRLDPRNERQMEETAEHVACMMIGVVRFPQMKARIDDAISHTPVDGVTMHYGDLAVRPSLNLRRWAMTILAGLGMSPSQMRLHCGGVEVIVQDDELRKAMQIVKTATTDSGKQR